MKRLILTLIVILLLTQSSSSSFMGVVDNSATRDTLSVPFMVLDSIGKPVDLADGDSVYLVVFYPGGSVAFKDSMAYNDGSIKSYDWEDFNGGKSYSYTEQVSVLDGSSPVMGIYSYFLYVDDNTAADLVTTYNGTFQVITSTFDAVIDSSAYAYKAYVRADSILDSINGSATVAELVDSIYEELISEHSTAGTFGDSLPNIGISVTGADTADIKTMLVNNLYTKTTDSLLLKNRAEISSQISDSVGYDTTNIKLMLNNNLFARTGTDQVWALRGLHIHGTTAGDTAVSITGYTTGPGFHVKGGATSNALELIGGVTSGYSLYGAAINGNSHCVYLLGQGSGDALRLQGGTSGNGLEISSGTSTASAVSIHAGIGSGGDGIHITGDNQGSGIHSEGGDTGDGLLLRGGATDGFGLKCEAQTLGHGGYFKGMGNYDGIRAEGGLTGYDVYADIQGNLSGSVASVTDSVLIKNRGQMAAQWADSMWNSLLTNHTTAGTFGDSLPNTFSNVTGADTADIKTMWENNLYFGGFPGDSVRRGSSSDSDTLTYYNGGSPVLRVIYHHAGGSSGDAPTGIKIETP